jgi:hypothetical protein
MATPIAISSVETLHTAVTNAVGANITAAQAAQAQTLLFALSQRLFGPGTTSAVIKNGSL